MLAIVSDLHLSDGSTGETISPGAFCILAERLGELAEAASWRADGSYRPIERIDLILLGDVLDLIRSAGWAARCGVRPWGNPQDAEFVDQVGRISRGILEHNAAAMSVLRGLAAGGGLTVPPALRCGRPAADGQRQPVPVRIHYMVGNHDWMYHLSGPSYDALRRMLVEQMGLANRFDASFPHEISESEDLLQTMRSHRVTARHGDVFDPFNYEGDRDASSLGDVIVVELVSRFAAEVEAGLGNELPVATVIGLREIDNIRPLLLIPVWIDGLLEQTCPFPAVRKRVKTVWDRLADEFLEIDFVRRRDSLSPFDLVDGLERALKFSKRLSIGWASSIVEWLHKVCGSRSSSYYHHALTEQDFRNRRAKHVVYGHTHEAETVPLDASYAEAYVLEQTYFNAGTWRRVHRQTQLVPNEHEFIASDTMTYLVFFQADERRGRPYETWSGTLGHRPPETTVHRIDAGEEQHGRGESISASGIRAHAPHFPPSSVKPGVVPTRGV